MASIDNNEVNISTNSQEVSVSTERPEVSVTIQRNTPTVSVNRADVTVSSNNSIYEVGFYNLTDEQIEKIAALASVNISVVDSLDSEDSTKALSARQGKILNDKISAINLGDFDLSDYATKDQLKEVINNVYTKEDVTTLMNSLAEIIDTKLTVVDLTDASGNVIGKATTSNFGVNGTLYANDVNLGGVSLTSTIDDKVKSAKDALSNAIDSLSSDLTSTIDGLSDDIENVNTEIINTNNAVSTVSANVASLESDLQTTNDTLDTTVRLTTNTGKSLVTLYDWIEANFDRSVTDYIATRKPLVSSGDVAAFGAGVVDGGGSSSGSGTGASAMNQLTDVLLSNLSDKDILQYSTSKSKWINTQIESSVTTSEKENWNEAASWVNSIKGSDTDGIVNKWDEIVKFVDGFSTSTSLATEFKKYLPLSGGTMTGTIYIPSALAATPSISCITGSVYINGNDGIGLTIGSTAEFSVNLTTKREFRPHLLSSGNIDLGGADGKWKDGYFIGTVYAGSFNENGTALSSKYLQLSGGTMTGLFTPRAGTNSESSIYQEGALHINSNTGVYIRNGSDKGIYFKATEGIIPLVSSAYSIGSSSSKWKDAYFSGTVDTFNVYNLSGILTLGSSSSVYLKCKDTDSLSVVLGEGYFKPFGAAHGKIDLGVSGARWKDGYFSGTVYAGTFSGSLTIAGSSSGGQAHINATTGYAVINGVTGVGLMANGSSSTAAAFNSGGFHPYLSNTSLSIGISGARWKDGYFSGTVYATTFSGDLNGSASRLSIADARLIDSKYTVADVKSKLLSSVSNSYCAGEVTLVPSVAVNNWDNDSKTMEDGSTYSAIRISAGYNNPSQYAQWILGHYSNNRIGIVGRNYSKWTSIRWLAFEDGTVQKANQLATARTIWGQSFDGSGNVDGKLTINSSVSNGLVYKRTGDSNGIFADYYYSSASTDYWRFGMDASKSFAFILNATSYKFVITSAGNVGIGTASPAYTLDVSGTGRFTGNLTIPKLNGIPVSSSGSSLIIDGDIICTGDVVAQGSLTYTTNAQLAAVQDDVAALTASTMSLQATNEELVSENKTLKDELLDLKDTILSLKSKISKLNLE